MKILIIIACLLIPIDGFSKDLQYVVGVGGWSYHTNRDYKYNGVDHYNETHNTISFGIQKESGLHTNGVSFYDFNNSYNVHSNALMYSYHYSINMFLKSGFSSGLTTGYKEKKYVFTNKQGHKIKRTTSKGSTNIKQILFPSIILKYSKVQLNFLIIPDILNNTKTSVIVALFQFVF